MGALGEGNKRMSVIEFMLTERNFTAELLIGM